MGIDLTGKPICITGASSGIGLATARECARAGMPVVLAARREDRLREEAARINGAGGRAIAVRCDVVSPGDCESMIEACERAFGPVYSVFANAGYGVERAVHEMSDAEIREMFEVNFHGTLNTIRPALPGMIGRRRGHILICSSCVAKFSIPYFSVYSATKAAQNHISRAMNLELASSGVRVSSVHPVGTRTEFFDTAQRLSGSTPMIQHSAERFIQTPERVARAVVRCLRRPKPEVWTSPGVRLGMAIGMLFPSLADMGVRRMVREREAQRGAAPGA